MTNIKLFQTAINKANEYCENHNITSDYMSLYSRISDWYNHTDITDPEMLAAVALEFTSYIMLPYDVLIKVTEMYFPRYM